MDIKITCECVECICPTQFEIITSENLLNLIQHGRLTQDQIFFLKNRVDSRFVRIVLLECIATHNKILS